MEALLERLACQIRTLVEQYNELQQSNQQLNQGKFVLLREKQRMLENQESAISQIKQLVTKLKTLEMNHE